MYRIYRKTSFFHIIYTFLLATIHLGSTFKPSYNQNCLIVNHILKSSTQFIIFVWKKTKQNKKQKKNKKKPYLKQVLNLCYQQSFFFSLCNIFLEQSVVPKGKNKLPVIRMIWSAFREFLLPLPKYTTTFL